jgi:hypothetical protein
MDLQITEYAYILSQQYIQYADVIDAPKRCDTSVHHLHEWKLHELQHLQTLLMLRIHLWRCVTTW